MKISIAQILLPTVAMLTSAAYCAGADTASDRRHVRYHVTNLESLGGTSSLGSSINNLAWIAGRSNQPGDETRHATLWRYGKLIDLGTLGGPNSNVVWPVKNVRGIITGISQTAEPDPLGENWSCSAFFPAATGTGYQCVGFVWQKGVMQPLPTLGGTHGFATGSNNRGQVVGWAENEVRDTTCVSPQVLQFRAVMWQPRKDLIRELPPLRGDTTSAATAINDRGQVVGISGICDDAVGKFSAIHAVLWDDGEPIDLGNIGGNAWNTPMAINHQGDVAGFANVSVTPDGDFDPHAFLWTERDGMKDLGTLPGDVFSQAYGINARRQVVGRSCDAEFNCRAFLWERGKMHELQKLVVPEYDDVLTIAADIDDLSRITGQAHDQQLGEFSAFIANPRYGSGR